MKLDGYFDISPSEMAWHRNAAAEQVIAKLVECELITGKQAEDFLTTYTFVSVRNNSITFRIKKMLFDKSATEDSFIFPLVKVK